MSDKSIVPIVEVIENGVPSSSERIDPGVMQFIAQMSTTAQLVKLRKLEESKVPTGSKSFKWSITDVEKKIELGSPWISFNLMNDGPNYVYLRINTLDGEITDEAEVRNSESYRFDPEYPIITKIYLICNSGKSAEVRVYAEEGQRV